MAFLSSGDIFAGAAGACAKAAPIPIMSANSALTAVRIIDAPCMCPVDLGCALEALVALAVVAAALLDPLQAAVAVAGLVGVVLVEAGFHAGLAGGILGVFGADRAREHGIADRDRRGSWSCWRRRGCRGGAGVRGLARMPSSGQPPRRSRIGPCGSRSTSCR